ncbi:MAG: hypothetical protein AAFX87_30225 [Bacteroidota bacterium]
MQGLFFDPNGTRIGLSTRIFYLSNESNTLNYTYFDDLKIVHKASPVVQVDDYYPFGLTYNSCQRANNQENSFWYSGKNVK